MTSAPANNTPDAHANPLGGHLGPWLGGLMLLHLAFQSTLKVINGTPEQVFWLSCAVLLLGGAGLLLRSAMLVETAVSAGLMLHVLWIIDALCWIFLGMIPLGIAGYLPRASAVEWLGTSYHFYAMPTLLIVAMRRRMHNTLVVPASLALVFVLTVGSRAILPPAANINCAFELSFGPTIFVVDWINRLPGPVYLLVINLGMWATLMMPIHLALRHWAKASPVHRPIHSATTA